METLIEYVARKIIAKLFILFKHGSLINANYIV